MTQIPYLPQISVQIAFNPSNILTTPGTWTDVTQYLRDYTVKMGRQHYLDRVQSSTLDMTVSNRDGYFLNSSTNGLGKVIQPRLPIKILATWQGTQYNVFYGLIDAITEVVVDQQNIDLRISASDLLKYLSLKRLSNPTFYPTYAKVASTQNYYRVGGAAPAIVTQANGNGSTITYTANNSFTAGQSVAIYGLQGSDGTTSPLNLTGTIASATATYFTISGSTLGTAYNQNGVAYNNTVPDSVGGLNGYYQGQVSFPTNGSLVYDPSNCTDLSNGSTAASGGAILGTTGNSGSSTGIDLWINGANLYTASTSASVPIALQTCIAYNNYTSGLSSQSVYLSVDNQGYLHCNSSYPTTTDVYVLDANSNKIHVSDGQWHHVGVFLISGTLYVYCDGNFTTVSASNLGMSGQWYVGGAEQTVNALQPSMIGLIDEVVITGSGITQTVVQNRWIAGGLLKRGQPVSSNAVYSGDRIAEVLVLAGFGSVSGGALSLNSGIYSINDVTYSGGYSSSHGAVIVEPYYWDSPIYNSDALTIIQQITDTDTGTFFQDPSGQFEYYNRNYYGTWSGTSWSTSKDTNSYTPPSTLTFTDDGGSPYVYEANTLQILRDDADLWTTVKVSPQSGQEQVYETTSKEARWGYTTLTKAGTVHATLSDALSTATYLAFLYQSPLPRVANVELRARTNNGNNLAAIFASELGAVVRFNRLAGIGGVSLYSNSGSYPDVQGTIGQNMIIEAIIHNFSADPGDYDLHLVLDPYPLRPSGSAP